MGIRTQSTLMTMLITLVPLAISLLAAWHVLGIAVDQGINPEVEDALRRGAELAAGGPEEARLLRAYQDYQELAVTARPLHGRLILTYGAVVALAALLIAWGPAWWMAQRLLARVDVMVQATHDVAAGNLDIRLDTKGADELGALETALSTMAAELRLSRDRIGRLERTAAWKEVARRLAHEIKNPLTPVQLMVQEVRERYSGDDPTFRKLLDTTAEVMDDEVTSLRRLVEDFSSLAREATPRLEPVSPNTLLTDYANQLAETIPELVVHLDLEPNLPELPLDRTLMRRVLANLIQNAQQAAGGAGQIEIGAHRHRDEPELEITIRDHGPGVPPDHLERIFEPYFTRKTEGTGLGLAIARKIVRDHDGTIRARLPEGGGLEMVIQLGKAAE